MGSYPAGILMGLGLAFLQTFSCFSSRRFMAVVAASPLVLLSVSHVQMGLISLAILALSPVSVADLHAAWRPAAEAAGFYLMGQWCLFRALREQPASRISPLLGLKVVVLALMSVVWAKGSLSARQWLGVSLSASSAWFLNEIGGRLSPRVLVSVAGAVTGYALSDLHVVRVVQALESAPGSASLTGMAMSYLLCGMAGVPFACRGVGRSFRVWRHALPFTLSWLGSIWRCSLPVFARLAWSWETSSNRAAA